MKRSQLKTSTTLSNGRGLTVKQPLISSPKKPLKRGGKGRGPLEKRTQPQLINVADELWSRYIRLRDSEQNTNKDWVGTCITCPRDMVVYTADARWVTGAQCGHLIGRGTHYLRFDELNTNLQCAHCNAWLDKDEMITRYRKAVDLKYGDGTYAELKKLAEEHKTYHLSKQELLKIINDTKENLAHYYGN